MINNGICLGALFSKELNLLLLLILQRIICPRPRRGSRPFCPPKWPFQGDISQRVLSLENRPICPQQSCYFSFPCQQLSIPSHEQEGPMKGTTRVNQLIGPCISCCPSAVSAQSPRRTPRGSCRFLSPGLDKVCGMQICSGP